MTNTPPTAQLNDAVRIPTLPASVERIRALLASPDVAIADVVEAFRQDPPLAAKVLKIANSVHYGLREKTTSLPQAVSVLGLRTLSMIVLRAGVMSLYPAQEATDARFLRELWKHSVFTAQISEQLAKVCRRRGSDLTAQDFYTCGLLHDLGRIVLFDSLGEHYLEAVHGTAGEDAAVEAEELRLLGMGHPDAGYMAAVLWKIPEPIPSMIRCHHRPDVQPQLAAVTRVVACADEIANAIAKEPCAEPEQIARIVTIQPGGLTSAQLVEVIATAMAQWNQVEV